jgi:pyruvate/2-oxoglutarate/acetoin dehydrogenase E1 component
MERTISYTEAVREAADLEMARDPSVIVFGLDVDDPKAIQGTTKGLLQKYGPERVFGTPLSEDAMTGAAIGMALGGLRPIHVHIRMDFLMLAMNQLVNVAAKSRYMYGGRVHIPMVVRSMIGKSWGQGAQHSQGLHSFFMHVPGLKGPCRKVRTRLRPARRASPRMAMTLRWWGFRTCKWSVCGRSATWKTWASTPR